MHVLRIEHAVEDFGGWKQVFDSDPLEREKSGVRGYRILRAAEDPNFVLVDLEFADSSQADDFLARLREVWGRVDVMRDPSARVAELVEAAETG